jgi:hypothetical protein
MVEEAALNILGGVRMNALHDAQRTEAEQVLV